MPEITKQDEQKLSLKGEFLRKFIHLGSSAIPIGYYFLDKNIILYILIPSLALLLITEILKYRSGIIYKVYTKCFNVLLRQHEVSLKNFRINGATWMLLADVICILLFPKLIAITGMLILSMSDSFSAITGRMYAKKYFAPNRSYIGTFTFLLVTILVSFFTPKYFYELKEYSFYPLMAVFTTIADTLRLPIDDNFLIPLTACTVLYVLYKIFYPGLF